MAEVSPSSRQDDSMQSKTWVTFEESAGGNGEAPRQESPPSNDGDASAGHKTQYDGAVIDAETVHVSLDRSRSRPSPPLEQTSPAGHNAGRSQVAVSISSSMPSSPTAHAQVHAQATSAAQDAKITLGPSPLAIHNLHNVDLSERVNGRLSAALGPSSHGNSIIRQGFANGDVIVTLLPVNTRWPWVTPAQFRPELVPEELMAQGLTLTVEEFVHVMEMLTNDVRFNAYNVCYKRILISWIFIAFVVLLALLFSGITGLTLFGLGVMWLVLNAAAIFFCMWVKIKLNKNLEKCMARVNRHLLRHKIILGLDDRGKLSCHKVNLCFIYFDTTDCIKKLHEVIENEETSGNTSEEQTVEDQRRREQLQQRMDIEDNDIIITGSTNTRISRKQARAEMLLLRYLQRWAKAFARSHLSLSLEARGGRGAGGGGGRVTVPPRHCISSYCPCQYVEEHLKYKPKGKCPWRSWCFMPNFGFD